MYHGNTNERQVRELHIYLTERERNGKRQSTGPEPTPSRSIADPLAADRGMVTTASIF